MPKFTDSPSGKLNSTITRRSLEFFSGTSNIRQKLLNYSDYEVFDFLEYGWPVGYNGSSFRSSSCRNHTGATDFSEQSTSYLIKEASHQAVVGPSKDNPFNDPIALSPLNSVPKKDSSERHVIVDLNFPNLFPDFHNRLNRPNN
jgi:hypothetical protein